MKVWCAKHKNGWCALASQPASQPRYRDNMKTKCKHFVMLTGSIELREPTCEDCRERLRKSYECNF